MQTNYHVNMDSCYAGQIKYLRPDGMEGHIADLAIPFGVGVVKGVIAPNSDATGSASMGSVKLPTVSSDIFRGIACQKHTEHAFPYTAVSGRYVEGEMVDVARKCIIVVLVTGTVTVDSGSVYCAVDGTGAFTSDSGSNLAVPSGVFRSGKITLSNGDTVADLEINLPA